MKGFRFFLFIFLLIFLIFSPSKVSGEIQSSEIIRNPAGIDELLVGINQYGSVFSDGKPTKITINISIPQDDERQDVEMNVKKVNDEFKNVLGLIESENPENIFRYNIYGTVKVRANHLTSLPTSYTIPDDVKIYMQLTKNIQSNDSRIYSLAKEITKNAKDDFEKIAKLAIWVNEHMDYDLSFTGKNLDALSVLQQKRGVCAEYATLFIALARSIGIPARFVSGFSYGDRGWERHAYAEVYLGKWIPVDPLWLEIGYLDATHIKFGHHVDNYVKNNVEVTGFDVNNIEWTDDFVNFSVLSFRPIEKAEYELSVSSEVFRIGDEGLIMLNIVPKEFIVGKIVLEPCYGDYKIVEVEEKEKKVLFRPGEKQQIYWKIKINSELPRNFLFTCPMTINSRSFALKSINVNVNTQLSPTKKKMLTANLASSVISLGEEQKVYIKLDGEAGKTRIGVLIDDEKEEWEVYGDFRTVFSFTPKLTGEREVVVYTSEGEVEILKYNVTSHMNIQIENFTVPDYMKIGEKKNISLVFVNKGLKEEGIHAVISIDGMKQFSNFLLKNTYAIIMPISFNNSGLKNITVEVEVGSEKFSQTKFVEVYEDPVVYYETYYENGNGFLRLNVTKSKIKDVVIKIGEEERKVEEIFGEKTFAFSIPKGEYEMEIICKDLGGSQRKITQTIIFKEKNFLEIFLEWVSSIFDGIKRFVENFYQT